MQGHFIGGRWIPPAGGGIDVVNPTTEQVIDTVPVATPAEVDLAVAAARSAFQPWAAAGVARRAEILRLLAERLVARGEELAAIITRDLGAPITDSRRIQAALPATVTSTYVELLADYPFTERIANSLVIREPAGVVAAITPWNYPLHQAVLKIVPALAAGCTVVLKPSELAPLAIELLCELAVEAGVPPGVLNVVHGTGPGTGEALVTHPDVDTVSFTGSTRAGRRVAALAGEQVKKVTLELGGKGACVVLPGTDGALFEQAVTVGVRRCLLNSGQACNALSRLLVPLDRHDEAVAAAVATVARFTVGDPADPSTRIGPMVSAAQRDRVVAHIEAGIAGGATLACGGPRAPRAPGFFVSPTVFAGVAPAAGIAQEEIFGPVLAVISYVDIDDAVRIVNGTPYGLAAAVWSADVEQATAFAQRLRCGQVDINDGAFNPRAPFGGFGRSGFGREYGRYGLEEFLATKSLQLPGDRT